ncbi:MAG: tetratricopeptide (TPR) repeat protein [Porticoccus sp.]|jgi:tetratricopeptide (TPR) repeat protein
MNFTGNLTRILILCICVFSYHSVTIFAASAAVSSNTILDTFEEKKDLAANDPEQNNLPKKSAKTDAKDLSEFKLIVDSHLLAIEQKESEEGPYSLKLSEILYSLGRVLQSNRHPNEAIAVYRKALYIKRINDGLYGLSQEAILRGIIDSQASQGNITEATITYDQLLQVYLETYDQNSTDLIPLMSEISQWHLDAYSQTGSRNDGFHLEAAFQLYSDAIRILTEHQDESSTQLLSLLTSLATTCYHLSAHQQLYSDFGELEASIPFGYRSMSPQNTVLGRGAYFNHGRLAQEQILKILNEDHSSTKKEKALGQTNLGDWYLLFGKYQLAIDAYKESYNIVTGDEEAKEDLDRLYSRPAMLPRRDSFFSSNGSGIIESRQKSTPPSTGSYVNLLVDVTAAGSATNFNIQKIYPTEIYEYGERAIETIRSKKFRPRLKEGVPELATNLPIRVMLPNE